MTTTTPRYWQRWGLEGKIISVTRQHPDGRAESWAWGRWVEIPRNALPRYDDTLVDEIDEATALRIVADPDLFDDEWGVPDPEQADAEGNADREMADLSDEGHDRPRGRPGPRDQPPTRPPPREARRRTRGAAGRPIPMQEVIEISRSGDSHWFHPDVMASFGTEVGRRAYVNASRTLAYFVSIEQDTWVPSELTPGAWDGVRHWTVRVMDMSTGRVDKVGHFGAYDDEDSADAVARASADEAVYDRVRRERSEIWHIVDSTIAGAAITSCGRRMEPVANHAGGLVWASNDAAQRTAHRMCWTCEVGSLA